MNSLKFYSSRLVSIAKNLTFSFALKPYSSVLFISDSANWVLNEEIKELANITMRLGISSRLSKNLPLSLPRQSIFYASKYVLMNPRRYLFGNARVAFPYFHGDPKSGNQLFIKCMENLKRYHSKVDRIQVSHCQARDMILETGIHSSKVFMIPIGINRDYFPKQTRKLKQAMREKYDIPQNAVVIGSFQKDGEGWGEGNNPKLIKGPDIFLKAVELIKIKIKNLFVLLSGPSRGYVKQGLDRLKVPYCHHYLDDYSQIGDLFQCLDIYIISSREEGGPKAVLESMSSGIPLVTTKVGQAVDLVKHEKNGWMVDIEDFEGIAFWAEKALTDGERLKNILKEGELTAEAESYSAQMDRWKYFFQGFVDR